MANRKNESLTSREIQIKTRRRHQFTLTRRATIQRQEIISVGETVEKRKSSYTVDRNMNWYSHYGKQNGISQKIKNRIITQSKTIPLLGIFQKYKNTNSK